MSKKHKWNTIRSQVQTICGGKISLKIGVYKVLASWSENRQEKQQPKLLDCCLILRMNLEAIPYIPDTGNHKRRFGIYGI